MASKFTIVKFKKIYDIIDCEVSLKQKTTEQQWNWIIGFRNEHSKGSCQTDMLFAAKAMNIYKKAWMKVYEVKKDRMTKIENDVKMGTNHYVHGNNGNGHVDLKTAH